MRDLKGSVSVGRKVSMPDYGSLSLEYSEEFNLAEFTHGEVADKLAERLRDKLEAWELVNKDKEDST